MNVILSMHGQPQTGSWDILSECLLAYWPWWRRLRYVGWGQVWLLNDSLGSGLVKQWGLDFSLGLKLLGPLSFSLT